MKHWDKTQMVLLRYPVDIRQGNDRFVFVQDFPVNFVMQNSSRFTTNEVQLRDLSNVPKDRINEWVKNAPKRAKSEVCLTQNY